MKLFNNIQGWVHNGPMGNNLQALTDPMNVVVGGGGSIASDTTTGTVADVFIPDIWGPSILEKFDKTSVMLQLANDHSAALAGGGDVVKLPNLGSIAVGDAPLMGAPLGGTFDNTGDTGASTDITVNEHTVAHFMIPDLVKVQASYDLMSMYAGRLGVALAEAVDNYIVGQLILGDAQFSGASGLDAGISVDVNGTLVDKIDDIAAKCIAESGSMEGWNIVMGPTLYSTLANLGSGAGFAYGTVGSPAGSGFATTGQVGTLLGMKTFVTNNAYMDQTTVAEATGKNIATWDGFDSNGADDDTELRGFVIHDDALHAAFKKKASVNATYEHLYLSHLMTSEVAYGMKLHSSNAAGKRRLFILHS